MTHKLITISLVASSGAADAKDWSPDRWRRELNETELRHKSAHVEINEMRITEVHAHGGN